MKEIILDCRGFVPRGALHTALAQALSLPDHYGRNLDALHDCLTAIPEDVRLVLTHWEDAEKDLGRGALALKRVLEDSAEENPHFFFTME